MSIEGTKALRDCDRLEFSKEAATAALALASADAFHRMCQSYQNALGEIVYPEFDHEQHDRKRAIAAKKTLCTQQSGAILTLVWKESEFISDTALKMAGIEKSFEKGSLNQHSLSQAYCKEVGVKDVKQFSAIQQTIARILEPAQWYGLVTRAEYDGESRQLCGTELLHRLMMRTHIENSTLIAALQDGQNG